MSRQTDRARARRQAKINAANATVVDRREVRKTKGLSPLSREQSSGYPAGRFVPVMASGTAYKPNGKKEVARRLQHATLQAAA